MHETLGIIAGSRSLPLELARHARSAGVERLVAVGFTGETNPDLEKLVDSMHWIRVGQLSKLISAFKDEGVTHCVMAGQVSPKSIFDVRPDLRGLSLLLRVKEKNAHTIFGAIANELRKDGIELIEATPWLKPLMPGVGFHLGPKLTPEQTEDVAFAYRIAKEVTRLEVGQLVVVKDGIVLAVEAFEGTDACLTRGGALAGKSGGAVAVKVAREKHDMRFDIPCLGPQTIQTCADAGVAVLAFEPEKTLLLDRTDIDALIKHHRIALVAASLSKAAT
jgi:UDP-2,3-diacylglucosamine hydrolase